MLKPGDISESLTVGALTRSYLLHVPASYTGKSRVPLVVDWHALQQTASNQKASSGYLALSEREGFIVAWPQGIDYAFDIGPCCTTEDVDDLAFAKALVESVSSRACVDPKRVYSAGYSIGAGMTFSLACNAADVFAAFAPSAFDLLSEEEQPCKPSRPISVIAFRGMMDGAVPYAGGKWSPSTTKPVSVNLRGAVATFQHLAKLNGCTDTPMARADGCQVYSACKDGAEVELCTKADATHSAGDAAVGYTFMKRHLL